MSFWGPFSQNTCFLKEEFSNEMFWHFIYIVFIVAPICHIFFYNQIWRNMNFWKCTNFAIFLCFVLKTSHNFKSYQNMLTLSSLIFNITSYKSFFNNIYIASHLHVEKNSWTFFKPLFIVNKKFKNMKNWIFLDVFNSILLL